MEKTILRAAVALASLVPIGAGCAGIWRGAAFLGGAAGSADLDSHIRYLSGLLLAIGFGFVSTIRHIEQQGPRFRLLTALVIAGGLGRLLSAWPLSPGMFAALVMELGVTPALALWQGRVARQESRRR